ncbi:hypothetical protein MRX96_014856 [Rhipicephalus microplus]
MKRYVYDGGFPLKRFKGFHRIDSAVMRRTSNGAEDTSSPENQPDLGRISIEACPDKAKSPRAVSEHDGFIEKNLAMADDCNLQGK